MSSAGHTTTSSNFQLIIDALADYAEKTGINLPKSPFAETLQLSKSPDDILQLLQEREMAFKEYRNRNRTLINCLSPAVKVLHAFSVTLAEAVSLTPFPPAKAIFVGIDVLLAAASGVSSSYDALLDLFEYLGNFLKRLEIYTNVPPSPIMTDMIVKIMANLIAVLGLATKQIKHGRLVKFAKKLLGESEVGTVLQRLDRLTQEEARMTVAQTLGVVHGLVNNVKIAMEDGKASTDSVRQDLLSIHQMINETNKMNRDQLQRDVQRWLSPPDPSTNHDIVWKAHHNGTAAWFFESHVLREWRTTDPFLWIRGKPGSGKSTLLSAIIQDIEGLRAVGLATMAYYYFDFRDAKKQDRYGLLSSLLSQLSAESDSCYGLLSRLYSDNAGGTRRPTSSALTKCMKDMLSLPGQEPIYILVDALDECPDIAGTPSAREEVLELVEELVNLQLPHVHLCVASRPEIDIRKVLEPLKPLQISLHDESGQKDDIIEYIKSAVYSDRKMRSWREEDKQLVIAMLSDKADGMFRWVVCQIDRLRRAFPASIRSALDDLPKTLDETYARALLGIDDEKREYAQRLFRCLTVSIRPLRVQELAEIFAVRFDEAAPPTFNTDWRPLDAEEAVLSACSSLISVVHVAGSQIVQFSHFSVKEYLTSERLGRAGEPLSCYHILLEPAHTILAHASLSVLLQLDDNIDKDIIHDFPLAQYAAQYWVDHAKFKGVSTHVQEVLERLFDPAKTQFAAWVWLYDIDRHWVESMSEIHPTRPRAGPLYYATCCGFRGLVEHLVVSLSLDISSRGGSHVTPLHAASVKGHLEVASFLLESGADPNSRDDQGRTPLHRVAQGGPLVVMQSALEITRLLLKSGASVNVPDDEGWTPLHRAARGGHRDITELLLDSGASLHARNRDENIPLALACRNGKLNVARFLLDRGSNLHSRNKDGWTPLHTASRYGHVDIARLLLDRGADVNAHKANRWTPLHLASGSGHIDIAKLLIQGGADVDSRNDRGETPLDHASANAFLDMARFLIERGATVSSRDDEGWTPFHTASKFGHLHIVRFLLECGVDVDIRNGNEETSLHLASSRGNLDVVRFLIEQGADIHARDNNGWNPLHLASLNGLLNVVRLLVDAGTAFDARNGTHQTPLALASSKGRVEVSRFLIERGANVNARDNESWAPVHFASRYGHLEMTRLLLDNGVDANVQKDNLWSPLHLASANRHLKVAEFLVQHGARVDVSNDKQETPLDRAADIGDVEVARLLMDHGANVHTTDSNGWTPLHTASHCGNLGVAKLLLRRGADVDMPNKANKTAAELASENNKAEVAKFLAQYKTDASIINTTHTTTFDTGRRGADESGKDEEINASLLAASEAGELEVVKSFLEQGADINGRSVSHTTPLCLAATKGHLEVVRLLIEQGAEVDLSDKWGWTPLHKASRYGHLEISRVLLDHGASVNAREKNHWTPMHLSARNGFLGVVELLLERGADVRALHREGLTPYQLSLDEGSREVADLLRKHGECEG